MTADGRHAEIAGGGISGMTLAAALAQQGWTVRVHERAEELREIGAGITVWQNGLRALRRIGAADEAIERGEVITNWEVRDERGRALQRDFLAGESAAGRFYGILRTDLHRAISRSAIEAGVEVVTSSAVAGATVDGELILEDGTRYQADLVVGADGINGAVRESLGLTKEIVELGKGCARHMIRRRPDDLQGVLLERMNGNRRLGFVPLRSGYIFMYTCCPVTDKVGMEEPLNVEAWSESFPEFAYMLDRIHIQQHFWPYREVRSKAWHLGKAAIVGDSAHAMSADFGQGANLSMSSVVSLADALSAFPTLEEALNAWEDSEREIIESVQRYARWYGNVVAQWPGLFTARSAFIWGLGKSGWLMKKLAGYASHVPDYAPSEDVG